MAHIGSVIVPAALLYFVVIPFYIIWRLIQLRNNLELYPGDVNYQAHWTTRFGFLFAGYEPEYAWWEVIVLLRKATFVVSTIFVKSMGPVAQVIAAVLVLVLALSLQLRYSPYELDGHDKLESASLHASVICLPLVLLMNELSAGKNRVLNSDGQVVLGVVPSIVITIAVLGFTVCIFALFFYLIVKESFQNTGLLGRLSRRFFPNFVDKQKKRKEYTSSLRLASRKKHVRQATMRKLPTSTSVVPIPTPAGKQREGATVDPSKLKQWKMED